MTNIAFCITGSYCTFAAVFPAVEGLIAAGHTVQIIFSQNAYSTDTRFGEAADWIARAEAMTGKAPWHSITEVEPIGPKKLFDLLIIAPCTGNTLGKLAKGISDTAVTMAAKAHLRNERPVLIGVSTNDALSGSAENLGKLLNTRHMYFIPLRQDDAVGKPRSLVADFSLMLPAVKAALCGEQIQPMLT
ncbi:MAG: dipicolinate synthase subunit B [Oscillospiraceae bacterium]|jgi:dipicolinate synthase subunit B|nr:dipicolinate synthase subunit B [Oscillospiraceae bacterium]